MGGVMKKEQTVQAKVKLKKIGTKVTEIEGDIEDNVPEIRSNKQKKFKKRLFLGEATFSYTDAFLLRQQEKLKEKKGEFEKMSSAIVATEYRKEEEVYEDYPEKQEVIKKRIGSLQTAGVQLKFEIDAQKLEGKEIKIQFNISIEYFLKKNSQVKDSYVFLFDSKEKKYCLFYVNSNGKYERIESSYRYEQIIDLLGGEMVNAYYHQNHYIGDIHDVLQDNERQKYIDTALENCKSFLWEIITSIPGHESQNHNKQLGDAHFKRIHFNFPQTDNNDATKNLVSDFFKSAKHIQNKNDKIHMALPKDVNGGAKNVFKNRYDILNASSESSYILEKKRTFTNTKDIHDRNMGFDLYYFPEGVSKYKNEGIAFWERHENSCFLIKQKNTMKIWRVIPSYGSGSREEYKFEINKFYEIVGENLELLEEGKPLKSTLDSEMIDKLWNEIVLAQEQYHRYPQYKHERTKDYQNDKSYFSVNNSREFIFKKTDLQKEDCLKITEKNLSVKTDNDSSDCYESDTEGANKLKK
jgi:hypothetical protein